MKQKSEIYFLKKLPHKNEWKKNVLESHVSQRNEWDFLPDDETYAQNGNRNGNDETRNNNRDWINS